MTRQTYKIAAYFPEWEARRSYFIKNIVTSGSAEKITIINYAFGVPGPDEHGNVVCQFRDALAAYAQPYSADMSVDGEADMPGQALRGHFQQLRKLKSRYPQIRVVLSLGGWTESGWFSDAARTPETRRVFVASCIDRYIHGNLPLLDGAGGLNAGQGVFDGIDIDWEYPLGDGLPENHVHAEDDVNFVLLLEEFRRQYQEIGRPELLLTAAVPGPKQAGQFQMENAHTLLDYVALMTYDLRTIWSPIAGHHTNLFDSDFDPTPEGQRLSADATVKVYRAMGVPPEKILVGAAFYGRGWRNVAPEHHGLYQPATAFDQGAGNYYELVEKTQSGYARYWDNSAKAPYLYSATEGNWISFDDPESLAHKAGYVREHGLGGVMFWEISADTPDGALVDALAQHLHGEDAPV